MQLEATGKNVELAIQNGLLECGMKREEVEVKVLDNGGLFKKAKVLLIWGEEKQAEPEVEETQVEEIQEEATEVEKIKEEVAEIKEKKVKIVDTTRLQEKGKEFLLGLVKKVDETATVEVEVEENQVTFMVKGENVGKLIGYHGDTLAALQTLVIGFKNRGEWPVRLIVDVDGYKSSKNQILIDLANKTADQAVKIERNIHLDPMNAYERRIIHTTIQQRSDVTTESTGEGEKRHVVVKPIFKR